MGCGTIANMTQNALESLHKYEYSTHFHYSLYLVLTRGPAVILPLAAPLPSALPSGALQFFPLSPQLRKLRKYLSRGSTLIESVAPSDYDSLSYSMRQ